MASRAAFGAAPACPLGCPSQPGVGGRREGAGVQPGGSLPGEGWDAQADGPFRVARVLRLCFSPWGEFCSAPGLVPGEVFAGRGSPGQPAPPCSSPQAWPPPLLALCPHVSGLCSPAGPRCSLRPRYVALWLGAAPCKSRAAPARAFGR